MSPAHLGDSPKSVYASVQCNYTKCNITKTLEKIDNSIYILGGEAEPDIDLITKEYTKCNPANRVQHDCQHKTSSAD